MLGIQLSAEPGGSYVPATLNGDGSINSGWFEPPAHRGGAVVPRTE